METATTTTDNYVAYCPVCKAMRCASVDEPAYKKENAKAVADWIRRGLTVGRATDEEVRAANWKCGCREEGKR